MYDEPVCVHIRELKLCRRRIKCRLVCLRLSMYRKLVCAYVGSEAMQSARFNLKMSVVRLGIDFFHFCLGRFEEVEERLSSPGAGVEVDTG